MGVGDCNGVEVKSHRSRGHLGAMGLGNGSSSWH